MAVWLVRLAQLDRWGRNTPVGLKNMAAQLRVMRREDKRDHRCENRVGVETILILDAGWGCWCCVGNEYSSLIVLGASQSRVFVESIILSSDFSFCASIRVQMSDPDTARFP